MYLFSIIQLDNKTLYLHHVWKLRSLVSSQSCDQFDSVLSDLTWIEGKHTSMHVVRFKVKALKGSPECLKHQELKDAGDTRALRKLV